MNVRRESRHEVIDTLRRKYVGATCAEKGALITQAVEQTGYESQYARRLLHRGAPKKRLGSRHPSRSRTYKHTVMDVIIVAAEAMGWICSKRLVAALPDLLPALEQEGVVTVSATVRTQVLSLSAATIDRRLSVERRAHHPHGISTTKPGSMLRSQIPIRTFTPWAEETPGFLEIDLVAHCGDAAAGDFVYTLTAVDIATGWTECVAMPNKRQFTVRAALQDLHHVFPFPIRGIDCDNGSAFLNETLLAYARVRRWTFTRARAYHAALEVGGQIPVASLTDGIMPKACN